MHLDSASARHHAAELAALHAARRAAARAALDARLTAVARVIVQREGLALRPLETRFAGSTGVGRSSWERSTSTVDRTVARARSAKDRPPGTRLPA
jgi:hypothetical protein